jgi:hypothetical protein
VNIAHKKRLNETIGGLEWEIKSKIMFELANCVKGQRYIDTNKEVCILMKNKHNCGGLLLWI